MSFDTMKVSDLKKVAEGFGIELTGSQSKQAIILALQEEGVTWEMYSKFTDSEKVELEEPKVAKKVSLDKAKTVLVKMDKANPSYTVYGHMFTQEHPFVAMTEDEATRIFDTEQGFRPATPREIQEFYN